MNNTDTKAVIPGLFVISGSPYRGNAKMTGRPLRPAELFLVLDLERPGLETVKAAAKMNDLDTARAELLKYYRERKEPGWQFSWASMSLQDASAQDMPRLEARENDLHIAGNADKHIFQFLQAVAEYPPHDYGPDIDWDADPVNDIEWLNGTAARSEKLRSGFCISKGID